ncbi:MAG: murein biosynthesis integral membrane protein MurJ [Candidatus Rokuibacteriota bacterium]
MTVERQVVRALGSISTATLASRVLGFVRDMVVALAFGAGPVTDAFFVAFRIPNMLRRLLGEGALSTALVPVFTEYATTRSRDEFLQMLRAVLAASLAALSVTTLVGIAAAPWILRVVAPGFTDDPGQMTLAVLLTRAMFPYLVLVGLAALAMGALHAHGRFFAAALGPAVLNVGIIVAVLLLAGRMEPPILALAVGVLAGGAGQLLVQVPSLRRAGLLVLPSGDRRHPALVRMARLLVPAVFGLAAVQVTVLVNTLLASLLPGGSISFLYYADRVMEFPLGVFGIAQASASLPAMSRQAAVGDRQGLGETVNFTLRLALYVALPATAGLVLLRMPITRVLFERGRFGPEDTAATAQALAWYAVGLVGFSMARILAQVLYALGEPGTAVKLGLLSVGANVIAALALMEPLAHGGLALASSVGGYVNVALLLWVARRRLGRLGGRALAASLGRTLAACGPLVGWCALCLWTWPAPDARWLDAGWLALAVVGGAVAFWSTSRLLAAPESTALRAVLPLGRTR